LDYFSRHHQLEHKSQVDTLFSAKVIAVSRFKAPQMRIDSVAVNGDELSIAVMGDHLIEQLILLNNILM
jgi:hypothetical protein